MRAEDLKDLKGEHERKGWHRQYIRNALATIGQITTGDRILAGHLLDAEQALRKAALLLDEQIKNSNPAQ